MSDRDVVAEVKAALKELDQRYDSGEKAVSLFARSIHCDANERLIRALVERCEQAETDLAVLLRTYAEQSEGMRQLRADLSKAMAHIRDMACAADVREMDLAVCKAEVERMKAEFARVTSDKDTWRPHDD